MRSGVALWKTLIVTGVALVVIVVSSHDQVFGEAGTWTVKAPMPTPRASLAVGVVNGILYAVGGSVISGNNTNYLSTVEAYDPSTNTWTAKARMPTARCCFAVGVANGILYVVGGISRPIGGRILGTAEAYDPRTNTWATKAPMTTPRWSLGVGVVNGILYAVAGAGGPGGEVSVPLSTVEAYDPTRNIWTVRTPMPTLSAPPGTLPGWDKGRSSLAVGVVNGILYAVGGACCAPGENVTILSTVEAYDPTTDKWTAKALIPTPRCCFAVGVVNGILYAVGGASPHITSAVEAYDPTRNIWTVKAPMPTARFNHAVGVANGILYTVGGINLRKNNTPPGDWISEFARNLLAFRP